MNARDDLDNLLSMYAADRRAAKLDAYEVEITRKLADRAEGENPDRDADFSAGVDWVLDLLRGHADRLEGGGR